MITRMAKTWFPIYFKFNMFHFPNVTHEERQIVALIAIDNSIRGISKTILLIFFTIPLIFVAINVIGSMYN